ncbi:hypothetical protein [Nocardioides sp. NPDC047086]|uniref:hypothetical protein n=1 Tax=Nocardioides sp. NPDC047086 TaxID=3154810 RepID=UPI0033C0EA65
MSLSTLMKRRLGLLAVPAAAGLLAVATAAPAHAAPLDILYDANGTTLVASTGSQIPLGPAVLDTTLETTTGAFTGSLSLPGASTEFKAAGFIPMSADVAFEEAAPTTGSLKPHPEGGGSYVEATSYYNVRLTNIKVVGFPTFSGPFCRTVEPVAIPVATPEGERFGVFTGGRLTGTYSIGDFQNCGLNTWLVNALVPGDGNTIELDLTNPRRG